MHLLEKSRSNSLAPLIHPQTVHPDNGLFLQQNITDVLPVISYNKQTLEWRAHLQQNIILRVVQGYFRDA